MTPISSLIRRAHTQVKRVLVTRGEDGRLHSADPVVKAQLSAFHQLADEVEVMEEKLREAKYWWGQWVAQYEGLERNSTRWTQEHKDAIAAKDAQLAELESEKEDFRKGFIAACRQRNEARFQLSQRDLEAVAERDRCANHALNFDRHTAERNIRAGLPYPLPTAARYDV